AAEISKPELALDPDKSLSDDGSTATYAYSAKNAFVLKYYPSTKMIPTSPVSTSEAVVGAVIISVAVRDRDGAAIRAEHERAAAAVRTNLEALNRSIDTFNASIDTQAKAEFDRIQEALRQRR